MAGRKIKVKGPDGQDHDGVEMSFQNAREHWNEYLLDDGTILRLKPVATGVVKIEGMYDQQGNPIYILNSTNIMVASAPDHLRRGGGGGQP
jgi:hypothetical protein